MIKLNRTSQPAELTDGVKKNLIESYKQSGKSVWNQVYIKRALLQCSNDKCCYCEANVNEESKYMEVDHFHHKDLYPDELLDWENLLPSCKKCNATKNDHDTKKEPIINPTEVDPKNHLKFWRYRIKGVDEIGKMTVSVLNLNDQDRLVKKRFEIGNALQKKLEELNELVDDYIIGNQSTTRRRNRVINGTKEILKEGLSTAIYSATSAAIILTDIEYRKLKNKLNSSSLWDSELTDLEINVQKVALQIDE